MKHVSLRVSLGAFVVGVFGFAGSAFASVTPTLSLSATGTGDNVQVNVNGDPNASVVLSYNKAGSGLTVTSIGTTGSNGNFSTSISSASYGLTTGTLVTAMTGSLSSPASSAFAWPTVTSGNSLTLSQNAVVLNIGSSANITASNSGSGALYVSNNSNPSIANVNISGTSATIYGNITGSTNITLCQTGNVTTNCPSVYVIVNQSGSGQLSFSQANPTIVNGQNLPITVTGGNGTYIISSNSNSSIIQASMSGSILNLTTGSTSGSTSIVVCSSDRAMCGVVNATAGDSSNVSISFSTTAPTISANQSTTVSIYGPSGVTFYVSSNSNPSIVQANLSGTTLTLTGISAGSSTVNVCASTGTCNSLAVTVRYSTGGGALTLSQNTLSLSAGQSLAVTISGGSQPYAVYGGTSSVSQQTLNGNIVTVYGVSAGTSSVDVCSSGGACVTLTITVGGTGTTSGTTISMSQNSVSLAPGQNATINLYGNGSYYLSNNTYQNVASLLISGTTASVSGLSTGVTTATICQNNGSCATLAITVSATTPVVTTTTAVVPTVTTPSYVFTLYLASGMQSAEVTQLQKLLVAEGYLSATPNGYFGTQTKSAVMKFQSAHGIQQLGVIGPSTRTALNAVANSNSGSVNTTDISTMTMSELQARVQVLQAELSKILARIAQLNGR